MWINRAVRERGPGAEHAGWEVEPCGEVSVLIHTWITVRPRHASGSSLPPHEGLLAWPAQFSDDQAVKIAFAPGLQASGGTSTGTRSDDRESGPLPRRNTSANAIVTVMNASDAMLEMIIATLPIDQP